MYSTPETEWLSVLSRLWYAIGKDPEKDPKRFETYAKTLSVVPLGLLETAVTEAITSGGVYSVVPTLGVVMREVRKAAGGSDIQGFTEAIEGWVNRSYEGCIVRF